MKKYLCLLIAFIVLSIKPVYAQNYYTNSHKVTMTYDEYKFIGNLYYDGYQDKITQAEYNDLKKYDLFERKIETTTFYQSNYKPDPITPKSTSITSNGRKLTISKVCSSKCMVTLTTRWTASPNIKSWDVIGMRSSNCSIDTIYQAEVSGTGYVLTYNNPKTFTNGFGYSVSLPNVSNIVISTSALVTTGGKIYGAYEHAMSSVSEATSKLYNISSGGQGAVFSFYGTAIGKYDNVPGVQITT